MPVNVATILAQIDSAMIEYGVFESNINENSRQSSRFVNMEATKINTRLRAALDCYSPPDSPYRDVLRDCPVNSAALGDIDRLAGALAALREDYATGLLSSFREMVTADLFSDFLEMAEYLLDHEQMKDAAAVLVGGVMEQHIRKLCDKNGIALTFTDGKGEERRKALDAMNSELKGKAVYGTNQQKQVTAWAAIRNNAAHAEWDKYEIGEVRLMAQGIRLLVSSYPA